MPVLLRFGRRLLLASCVVGLAAGSGSYFILAIGGGLGLGLALIDLDGGPRRPLSVAPRKAALRGWRAARASGPTS